MKKKLAPFLSGVGTGLCLAVVILTLWGIFGPGKQDAEGADLEQAQAAVIDNAPSQGSSPQEAPSQEAQGSPSQDPLGSPSESLSDPVLTADVHGGKVIAIQAGMSAKQIADLLAQEGIIDDAEKFHNLSIQYNKTRWFKAGQFTLKSGMSYEELLGILTIPS
jgi:hypothetical protein